MSIGIGEVCGGRYIGPRDRRQPLDQLFPFAAFRQVAAVEQQIAAWTDGIANCFEGTAISPKGARGHSISTNPEAVVGTMAKDLDLVVLAPLLLQGARQIVQALATGIQHQHGFALPLQLCGQGPQLVILQAHHAQPQRAGLVEVGADQIEGIPQRPQHRRGILEPIPAPTVLLARQAQWVEALVVLVEVREAAERAFQDSNHNGLTCIIQTANTPLRAFQPNTPLKGGVTFPGSGGQGSKAPPSSLETPMVAEASSGSRASNPQQHRSRVTT